MMKLKSLLAGALLAAFACVHVFAQGVGQLGSGQLLANPTTSPNRARATSLSAYLDFAIGSTANGFPARISGSWTEAAFGSSFVLSGNTVNLISALANLPTGTQDTALGYWTSTAISSTAIPNCTGALTYSTSTHTYGCSALAGTGTVTQVSAGTGITVSPSPITTQGTVSLTVPVSSVNGGTGVSSPASHTLPINEGPSAQNNTGTGSLGQCVNSGGASADPAFVSGCWKLLNTLTANNSAALQDTSSLTSTYSEYMIVWHKLLPASTTPTLELQVHSGGTYQATSYLNTLLTAGNGSSSVTNPTTFISLTQSGSVSSSASTPGADGFIIIHDPSGTSIPKNMFGMGTSYGGTVANGAVTWGFWNGNGAIDGFQIFFSGSVNITSGYVEVYGRI